MPTPAQQPTWENQLRKWKEATLRPPRLHKVCFGRCNLACCANTATTPVVKAFMEGMLPCTAPLSQDRPWEVSCCPFVCLTAHGGRRPCHSPTIASSVRRYLCVCSCSGCFGALQWWTLLPPPTPKVRQSTGARADGPASVINPFCLV